MKWLCLSLIILMIPFSMGGFMTREQTMKGQASTFLKLLNEIRVNEAGVGEVVEDPQLQRAAEMKVLNMKQTGTCTHNYYLEDGTALDMANFMVLPEIDWHYHFTECAMGGASKAGDAIWWFRQSNAHWTQLMNPRWTYIGVGKAAGYWSVFLGVK